jgi:hypothetical protein
VDSLLQLLIPQASFHRLPPAWMVSYHLC